MNGPTQIGLGYGGMVAMVYFATDQFRNKSPLIFALPVAFLGLMTLTTRMAPKHKLFTALSFFVMSYALYHWTVTPKAMKLSGLLICLAHTLYLFSFWKLVHRVWYPFAAATLAYMGFFSYYTFADLYRSYFNLICILCFTLFVLSTNFIAAGSIYQHGSKLIDAQQAANVRFVGVFLLVVYECALMSNHFSRQVMSYQVPINFAYYLSQFLMFYANEQAF